MQGGAMLKRFGLGFVVGYVVGSRSGENTYEQVLELGRKLLELPVVKDLLSEGQERAKDVGRRVTTAVRDSSTSTTEEDYDDDEEEEEEEGDEDEEPRSRRGRVRESSATEDTEETEAPAEDEEDTADTYSDGQRAESRGNSRTRHGRDARRTSGARRDDPHAPVRRTRQGHREEKSSGRDRRDGRARQTARGTGASRGNGRRGKRKAIADVASAAIARGRAD